jgi:hypothetical protein
MSLLSSRDEVARYEDCRLVVCDTMCAGGGGHCFRGSCCFRPSYRKPFLKDELAGSSAVQLCGITSQKTIILLFNTVRTSNCIYLPHIQSGPQKSSPPPLPFFTCPCDVLHRVYLNMIRRAQLCIDAGCNHFQHLLWWFILSAFVYYINFCIYAMLRARATFSWPIL